MIVTREWLSQWFDVFCRDYFSSRLPRPVLVVSHARTRLGQMSCKKQTKAFRVMFTDFRIAVSDYYDMTESQAKNVLLHEMIHYAIAFDGIRDTSPHGVVFRRMADQLNRQYGWNIRVSEPTKDWQVRSDAPKPRRREVNRPYIVLALVMTDGRYFLTRVNPRYVRKLEAQLVDNALVKSRQWFQTTDAFFESFVEVRSLRGRKVSADEFRQRCEIMSDSRSAKQQND